MGTSEAKGSWPRYQPHLSMSSSAIQVTKVRPPTLPGGLMVLSRSSCSPTLKTCRAAPGAATPTALAFHAMATWMMRTTSLSNRLFSASRAVSTRIPSCFFALSRRSGSVALSSSNCNRCAARGTLASGSRLCSMDRSTSGSPPLCRYSWIWPNGSRSLRPARTSCRFSAPSMSLSLRPPKLGSKASTAAITAGRSRRATATPTACASLSSSTRFLASCTLAVGRAFGCRASLEVTKADRS
mmetsp:Transcript_29009/g.79637  ORF Transcript_29009/g.79637 Transcript_29009/m.79637 type:complete len:241 (+) Transcript_29009:547-1269(+)